MDAAKAPKVLIFQIGAVAVLIDLDGDLVFTMFEIWRDVELRGFHRPLAVAYTLPIDPYIKSTHHALKAQESLAAITHPTFRHDEGTAVLPRGVTLFVGSPVFLRLSRNVGRIYLERIAGRDIDRGAVAVHLPIGRHGQRLPCRIVEVGTVEVYNPFIGCLCPTELPVAIE